MFHFNCFETCKHGGVYILWDVSIRLPTEQLFPKFQCDSKIFDSRMIQYYKNSDSKSVKQLIWQKNFRMILFFH